MGILAYAGGPVELARRPFHTYNAPIMPTDALLYCRAFVARHVIIEGAGLFWLGAEVVILFGAILAHRHLVRRPRAERLVFARRERIQAVLWALGFLVFSVLVLGRHFVLVQPSDASELETSAAYLTQRHREHLGVWAAFVAGWVLLEGLIVYHGYRGYRVFRRVLAGNA